jgi:hypothetical protein
VKLQLLYNQIVRESEDLGKVLEGSTAAIILYSTDCKLLLNGQPSEIVERYEALESEVVIGCNLDEVS